MSTHEQKLAAHDVLSKALAKKHNEPLIRVTKVDWAWPFSTESVRLAAQKIEGGVTSEFEDIVVEIADERIPAGTSCYAPHVVQAVARRI